MKSSVAIVPFFIILGLILAAAANCEPEPEPEQQKRKSKNDEILWDILNECLNGVDPISTCLKMKVLNYYDYNMEEIASPRSLDQTNVKKLDRMVVKRFQRYLSNHEVQLPLPQFFFQGATLVFKPGKDVSDFDIKFPKSTDGDGREITTSARDASQHVKMLLPLLMLLKMKLKMITPIMLTLVSIKATKALVLSKLAILLVIGFLASQFFKKAGMQLPMLLSSLSAPSDAMHAMPMSMMTTPPPSYGPPPPPAPPQPSSSYGEPPSNWEPSSGSSSGSQSHNSYSNRMWDAQQMAYSGYLNNQNPSTKS